MILFIELLKRYWKAALILVIVAFFLFNYLFIKSQRDDALQTIADMQLEAAKKNAQVKLLTEQGKRDTSALQASYNEIVTNLLKAKDDDKKTISNLRGSLADRVRQQSDSYDRLPNNDANQLAGNDSNGLSATETESAESFYRKAYIGTREYIETLEQAGAVCAADYNVCRDYVVQEQKRIGVYSD